MSMDLDFNKSLSKEEIEEKTSLKVETQNGAEFLTDQYGNSVFFKGYGITLYGLKNPMKILDELIKAFDIMFIDDDAIEKLDYEPENHNEDELYWQTMKNYGYVTDGKILVPEREESKYLPYKEPEPKQRDPDDEFPF